MKLIQNTVNQVDLTLNEKVHISAPVYFLFRIINDETQVSKTFLSADTTLRQIERYNRFVIELNAVEDPLNGVIDLVDGQYTYEVYAQHSSTNLDFSLANEKVEHGRCLVIKNSTVTNTEYEPAVSIRVYDPGS